MEDNSNEILTLLAKDELAAYMFNQPHNRDRYHKPDWRFDYARESTPSCAGDVETQVSGSSLKLTFDKMPKYADLGFTFGRDPKRSDVFLPKNDISGVHFRITFSPEGQLQLIDISSYGMWLSFNGQRSHYPRRQFTWNLTPDTETIEADFGDDHSPRFELKVPRHTNIRAYQENLAMFQKMSRHAGPPLGSLVLSSHAATTQPSRAMSPRGRPWYLREDVLGRGQFGIVSKARDLTTNKLYAIKDFHPPRAKLAKERLRLRDSWKREIEIMRSLPYHPHIVCFVDSCDEVDLQLVMEYLPRGNLVDERNKGGNITLMECVLLLRQGLQALEHLHLHGYTHRDIKPENILVHSRTPFHIKLADFGLSQSSSILFTFCGTKGYLAPEVAQSSTERYQYTSVIDIWALGVVVFQYAHSLPNERISNDPRQWARRIIAAANDCKPDMLMDILCTGMLVEDHRKRLSAKDCSERAAQISVEAFRLQSTQHQADVTESSTMIQGPPEKSQTATSGSENKLGARDSPKHDPPTVTSVLPATGKRISPERWRYDQIISPTVMSILPATGRRIYSRWMRLGPVITTTVTKDHIEVEVEGKMVLMRRSDAYFNAPQLLSLSNQSLQEQEEIVKGWRFREVEQNVSRGSHEAVVWLPFKLGEKFCCEYNLDIMLKPLLDYGNGFIACHFGTNVVMIRRVGLLINATHISRIGKSSQRLRQLKTKVAIKDGPLEYQGHYCSGLEGLKWCRNQKLPELAAVLKDVLEDYRHH